jgi:hypothetical protein
MLQPTTEDESFDRLMSYCYQCLKNLYPEYKSVECGACGFLLCTDGCTRCLCDSVKSVRT